MMCYTFVTKINYLQLQLLTFHQYSNCTIELKLKTVLIYNAVVCLEWVQQQIVRISHNNAQRNQNGSLAEQKWDLTKRVCDILPVNARRPG